MFSIRTTKTKSGARAVQVVSYRNRRVVVHNHIGSGHDDGEVKALMESASLWVDTETKRLRLFGEEFQPQRTLALSHVVYQGVTHGAMYEVLQGIAQKMGFDHLKSPLFVDLALMRLVEPCSKLRAITLLERYFGIRYAERTVYRTLPKLYKLKSELETIAVEIAQSTLGMDLSFVLYDVTTLYFESFESDTLRIPGFSKDNKSQQPQIVVGLLVTENGFPLAHEVFAGNTFEGHTMLPILESFVEKHGVSMPVVVADSAMLSNTVMAQLRERGISYIVGARIANCKQEFIEQWSKELNQKDNATLRHNLGDHELICSFSKKRYRKDKFEMDKLVTKAREQIEKGQTMKRTKFVTVGDTKPLINEALITKTTLLLGMKGFVTNIPEETVSNSDILKHYYDLWHVEQAFRMAKSDLETRPIFHYKQEAVKAHMLICFGSLMIEKYMELTTKLSLRSIKDLLWNITDAHILDTSTNQVITLRSPVSKNVRDFLKLLGVSY